MDKNINQLITQLCDGTLPVPDRRWIMAVGSLWGAPPPTDDVASEAGGYARYVIRVAERLLGNDKRLEEWNKIQSIRMRFAGLRHNSNKELWLEEYMLVILLYMRHQMETTHERTWAGTGIPA